MRVKQLVRNMVEVLIKILVAKSWVNMVVMPCPLCQMNAEEYWMRIDVTHGIKFNMRMVNSTFNEHVLM